MKRKRYRHKSKYIIKNVVARRVVRRFFKFFAVSAVISSALTLADVLGVFREQANLLFSVFLGCAAFVIINLIMLVRRYHTKKKKHYYVTNYLAYLLFIAVSLIIYYTAGSTVYTWLFSITKFTRYTRFAISTLQSAAIFHAVMLVLIGVAPKICWFFYDAFKTVRLN